MARLDVELRDYQRSVGRLLGLHANLGSLPAQYQKLVAEMVMLRLFDLFQHHVRRIVCKVACGSVYLDRSTPLLLHRAASMRDAEQAMKTRGRSRPLKYLRWSKVSDIKRNAKHMIDPGDHVLVFLDRHGQVIDEMRRVRNRIAHSGGSARQQYAHVVRQRYGAGVWGVQPGMLLLSPRWSPTVLKQYLLSTRVLIKNLVRS